MDLWIDKEMDEVGWMGGVEGRLLLDYLQAQSSDIYCNQYHL
jgi:hypothetical protein